MARVTTTVTVYTKENKVKYNNYRGISVPPTGYISQSNNQLNQIFSYAGEIVVGLKAGYS